MRMSHRVNVLAAYRELVSLIHRLSPGKIQPALQEARAAVQACNTRTGLVSMRIDCKLSSVSNELLWFAIGTASATQVLGLAVCLLHYEGPELHCCNGAEQCKQTT